MSNLELELRILVRQLNRALSEASTLRILRRDIEALAPRVGLLDLEEPTGYALRQLYDYLDATSRTAVDETVAPSRIEDAQVESRLLSLIRLMKYYFEGFNHLLAARDLLQTARLSIDTVDIDSPRRWALERLYEYAIWRYEQDVAALTQRPRAERIRPPAYPDLPQIVQLDAGECGIAGS